MEVCHLKITPNEIGIAHNTETLFGAYGVMPCSSRLKHSVEYGASCRGYPSSQRFCHRCFS